VRAAVFKTRGEPFSIETLPDPTPLAGELVIRVSRCGICGSDLSMTSPARTPGDSSLEFPTNSVLGHEYSGEVVEIGEGVGNFSIGDAVTAMPVTSCGSCDLCHDGLPLLCPSVVVYLGGFAEYMRIGAQSAMKLPAGVSLPDGALAEPLAVGLHGVALAQLSPGARVLILGGGSVGLAVLAWVRRFGAGRIAIASRSNHRSDAALALGATAFVQTGEGEVERIREALGGAPDVVFECAGAAGMLARAIDAVRPNGRIVSLGTCISHEQISAYTATSKQAHMTFSMAYSLREFRFVVDELNAGHIDTKRHVDTTIPLQEFPGTLERLRQGALRAKVHVDPWAAANRRPPTALASSV
jgi:threonine dehydrogenase-like Zn-dependent dehydrogenase